MIVKNKPDDRILRRFMSVGIRARYVDAYVDPTANFELKMRIKKVGENRIEFAVSSFRQLDLSEEKKIRFIGREVVFHILKIRS